MADHEHIHHRLLDRGLTPRRAALLLYAFCGIAAVMALMQESVQSRFGAIIVVLFCTVAWLGVQRLGYQEFGLAGKLVFQGALRETIDFQVRLRELERSLASAESVDDIWRILTSRYQEFGFDGIRMKFAERNYEHHWEPTSVGGWQLRITLSDGQYVNLYQDRPGTVHAVILTDFAGVVRDALTAKSVKQAVSGR
jgi:UDP-GlcNAc:undecaprenyl-phosphate GlcNAc-1-phosphate transferase